MLGALVFLVVFARWNAGEAALRELARQAEEAALRAKGEAVAARAETADLRARAEQLAAEVPGLRAELERAKRAAPGSRVVFVARGSTGPLPVQPPSAPDGGAAAPPAQPAPGVPAGGACLLSAGDEGEVRVPGQVALETRSGNLVLVGVAEAWRLSPAPAQKLFGGPLRIEAHAELGGAPRRAGWGGGVFVGVSREGWSVGPAASAPPLELWGWGLEVSAGAGIGPGGAWQAGAAAIVRPGR